MNKQQILKKIGEIIHDLNEQHQYLSNINKINILELELFTANADFLIDHIEILKKIEANALLQNQTEKVLPVVENINNEKIEPEIVKDIVDSESTIETENVKVELPQNKFFDFSLDEEPVEMIFDFEKKISVEEVFDRQLSDEEKAFLAQKQNEQELEVSETILEIKEEKAKFVEDEDGPEPFLINKSINTKEADSAFVEPKIEEVLKTNVVNLEEETVIKEVIKETVNNIENNTLTNPDKKLTLNEMLSSKLGSKVNNLGNNTQKQITDLKSAISLNDKMVFIKELFNGYNLAYSEAVEIINRFDNFEAADNFLQKNYAQKNDWEAKKSTVDRLYDYLGRKFKN